MYFGIDLDNRQVIDDVEGIAYTANEFRKIIER